MLKLRKEEYFFVYQLAMRKLLTIAQAYQSCGRTKKDAEKAIVNCLQSSRMSPEKCGILLTIGDVDEILQTVYPCEE